MVDYSCFDSIITGSAVLKKRNMSGSNQAGVDPYNPDDTVTYGYGDPVNYWVKSGVTCEVQPLGARDRMTMPGLRVDVWKRVFFLTTQPSGIEPEYGDMLEFPSGSGKEFWLAPIEEYRLGDTLISKTCRARYMYQSGSPIPEDFGSESNMRGI